MKTKAKTPRAPRRSSESPGSAIPCDEETWLLIRDLRNALIAASRVIVSSFATDVFIAETKKCGIPDGIGTRSQKWLDAHSPNDQALPRLPDSAATTEQKGNKL